MGNTQFWLVTLFETTVAVHLVETTVNREVKVIATGLTQHWQGQVENLVSAVDVSLSGCAQLLSLPQAEEPNKVAFILLPTWVSKDGRILDEKKKLIEQICRQLKLKPMGFTPYDEALSEYLSGQEGALVNLLIAHFFPKEIVCSYVLQGRVVARYQHPIDMSEDINPKTMEFVFSRLRQDTPLPSELLLVGDTPLNTLEHFLKYPWTAQRNPQLFLHLPTIKKYNQGQITQIYAEFVVQNTGLVPHTNPENVEVLPVTEISPPLPEPEVTEIEEIEPELMGFKNDVSEPASIPTPPALQLPKIKLDLNYSSFILPLLGIITVFFIGAAFLLYNNKATLILYANPVAINKTIKVNLSTQATALDVTKGIIPVVKKTEDVTASGTTEATGKKTTGEKAKGEITIYNKQEKSQTLPKNTVLKDVNGHRFFLSNVTVLAAAEPDLNAGVINLGQTKAMVTAEVIGSDGNLAKDTPLTFIDLSNTLLLAKVSQPFTGGSSREITVVSLADRTKLDQILNDQIKLELDKKVSEQKNASDIIGNTLKILKGKVDLSREVDEEASEVTGNISATVTIFYLEPQTKTKLIQSYLSTEPSLANTQINPKDVRLVFTNQGQDDKQANGNLTFTGNAPPSLPKENLKNRLAFKSISELKNLLTQLAPRVYDFSVTNTSRINLLPNRLPLRPQNLQLEITSTK